VGIVPQFPTEQESVQLTPNGGLLGSPVTTAVTEVELPAPKGEDGKPVKVMATALKILTLTVDTCDGAAVARAVRFTHGTGPDPVRQPCGTTVGAV
jgi:hypothetical protein